MKVTNRSGTEIDFDSAKIFMDDELREELHRLQPWKTEQQFFSAYEKAHEDKHGEEWELSKANPTW
jgi:glutaredoxin-related protein